MLVVCSHRLDIYPRECGIARASLFIDRRRIFTCYNFAVGCNREIILTAKISRSMVTSNMYMWPKSVMELSKPLLYS